MIPYGPSFAFDVDSSHLRIGLRTYFTALFLILAFLGDKYYHNRVKVQLMNRSNVKISMMTGWLSAFTVAKFIITQKCLPVGFFSIIMIFTQLLAFGSDLLVSGLVKSVEIPGRCYFGTGVVIPAKPVAWNSVPDPFQPAYKLVTQSQISSKANGGLSGIFAKSNGNSNFRAQKQDILGHWECKENQPSLEYNETISSLAVFQDLIDKGYLYKDTSDYYASGFPSGSWDRFLAWSPSVNDYTREPWNLKVAYNHGYGDHQPHLMRSFFCSMKAPSVEWILTKLYAVSTLRRYKGITAGKIYEQNNWDQPTEVASILESVLESIIMVGWGGDVNETDTHIGDPTQGCMMTLAKVPWPVCTLLLLTTIITLLHLIFLLLSELELRRLQSKLSPAVAEYIKTETPNGLIDWMIQAIREHNKHSCLDHDPKDIPLWKFGESGDDSATICSGWSAPLVPQHSASRRGLIQQSQSRLPESSTPESNIPESNVPESNVPESNVPESNVPESNVPESNVPESNVPESNVPESNVPESNVPESNVPESNVPESNLQESSIQRSILRDSTFQELTPPESTLPEPTLQESTIQEPALPSSSSKINPSEVNKPMR